MLRAQPSLCEAVSHAGSRTSCCECFLSYLTSSAPFIPPCLLAPLLFCIYFPLLLCVSNPVQRCLIEYFCRNSDSQFLSYLIVFLLAHISSQFSRGCQVGRASIPVACVPLKSSRWHRDAHMQTTVHVEVDLKFRWPRKEPLD